VQVLLINGGRDEAFDFRLIRVIITNKGTEIIKDLIQIEKLEMR